MIKTRFNLRILTVTSGFLGIFLLIPLQATAVAFSKIYAFGDSLSVSVMNYSRSFYGHV